eukprot:2632309-Pyramimonas_sp.AAC.1
MPVALSAFQSCRTSLPPNATGTSPMVGGGAPGGASLASWRRSSCGRRTSDARGDQNASLVTSGHIPHLPSRD